jgi:hypothetical protein
MFFKKYLTIEHCKQFYQEYYNISISQQNRNDFYNDIKNYENFELLFNNYNFHLQIEINKSKNILSSGWWLDNRLFLNNRYYDENKFISIKNIEQVSLKIYCDSTITIENFSDLKINQPTTIDGISFKNGDWLTFKHIKFNLYSDLWYELNNKTYFCYFTNNIKYYESLGLDLEYINLGIPNNFQFSKLSETDKIIYLLQN